jgi:hypothetical protein
VDACVFATPKMTCADQGPRRHHPIDSVQPEVGSAIPGSSAEAEKTSPDFFATFRRPHAPARRAESGLPSCLNTPRPRCTPKSIRWGHHPAQCSARVVPCTCTPNCTCTPPLSPATAPTWCQEELQRCNRFKPPCTLPLGRIGPKVSRLLHQNETHATSTSDNACGDQRRNLTPRSEAPKERPGRVLAPTHGTRSLPRAPTI